MNVAATAAVVLVAVVGDVPGLVATRAVGVDDVASDYSWGILDAVAVVVVVVAVEVQRFHYSLPFGRGTVVPW